MGRAAKKARKASPASSRKARRKTPFWERLVEELLDLEIDVGLLQAQLADKSPACALFLEGGDAAEEPDLAAIDESVYWFVLITRALETLLPLSSEEDAIAASDLALQWTDLFAGQKLNSASSSRSLVGRAVLVITEVCTQAIARYHDNMEIMLASTISLDAVSVAGSYDKTDWSNGVIPSWREYINSTEHVFPTKKANWTKLEACLDSFQSKNFEPFLLIPRIQVTDVRLSLKRWSPICLTWFGGQQMIGKALLEIVNTCPDFSGCFRVFPLSNSKKNRNVVKVPVPSEVTLLTIIARLCRILSTGSSVGGSKGPGGNLFTYIQEISGRVEAKPQNDHVFAQLLQKSLQRHSECIPQWVQKDAAVTLCLNWKVPESCKMISTVPLFFKTAVSFYAFTERFVTDVLSLVSNKILHTLAMSWILNGPIKDAVLCRWAISPLTAEMELLAATSEPLSSFQTVQALPTSPSGKTKLRKRKKSAAVSDESELLAHLLGKEAHKASVTGDTAYSRHDRFALFLQSTPNIMNSLLSMLEALYNISSEREESFGSATVKQSKRQIGKAELERQALDTGVGEPESKSRKSKTRPVKSCIIDSTRIRNVRTVVELVQVFVKFDTNSCPLKGCLAAKFGWEELRRLVLLSPLLSDAFSRHEDSIEELTFHKPASIDELKSLWEYHAAFLVCIGRASLRHTLKYTPNTNGEWEKLVWSIADQSHRHSSSSWPLALDSGFQILIGTYLQNQPANLCRDTSLTIVEGFVKELSCVFSSPDTLSQFIPGSPRDKHLLSLAYSRIILLAFSTLETTDQQKALDSILSCLALFLCAKDSAAVICAHALVEQFVARVITLCFSTYVVMRFRHEANQFVRDFKFDTLSVLQADESYLGLFIAGSFRLPLWEVGSLIEDDLSVSSKLQDVLEGAFKVGMSHELHQKSGTLTLGFAAYSALGQSVIWRAADCPIEQTFALEDAGLHRVVLQLRSDMYSLTIKCKHFNMLPAGSSTLQRLSMMKAPNVTIQIVWNDVTALLRKATALASQIMASHDEAAAPIAMVALDTALSCIAFAFSCCTSSDISIDIFSVLSGRKDSIESDDAAMSDGGSIGSQGSDPPSDGLKRLRDIVDTISSAPCHPDWLDQSHTLLVGLNAHEILKEVGNALKCFREIIDFSRNQIHLMRSRLLKEHNSALTDQDVALLVDILAFSEQAGHTCRLSYSDHECSMCDLLSVVSCAFDCEDTFLQKVSFVGASRCVSSQELIALKCAHLVHDVDGDSAKLPYLRATGNWEAMLSLALTIPVLENRNENRGYHLLHMWTTLQEHALSNMIPAAALFRFALARGGRAQHPLVRCNASDPIVSELFFGSDADGDGFPVHSTEKLYKRPVVSLWILELLSELPFSNASRSIANQLMQNQTDFGILSETSRMHLSFNILVALNDHASNPTIGRVMDIVASDVAKFSCSNIAPATVLGASTPFVPVVVDETNNSSCKHEAMSPLQQCFVSYLLDEISGKIPNPSTERRKIASQVFSTALSLEDKQGSTVLLDVVVELLARFDIDDLASLVKVALCRSPDSCSEVQSDLMTTLARIFARGSNSTAELALHVWPIIETSFDKINTNSIVMQESFVCVVLLCSLRCNTTFEFGSLLMSRVMSTSADDEHEHHRYRHMKILCSFVAGLGLALNESELGLDKNSTIGAEKGEGPQARLPENCTYLTDNDFRDQHWYNCGTCGLVGDKGCCSLCAVVCHVGHEVWYSRYGSFLCDCGEMTTNCFEREEASTHCLCLTQQVRDKHVFPQRSVESNVNGSSEKIESLNVEKSLQFLDLKACNREDVLRAYKKFTEHASCSIWGKTLLDMATKALHRWQNAGTVDSSIRSLVTATDEVLCNNGHPFLRRFQDTVQFVPSHTMKARSTPSQSIAYNRKGYLAVAEADFLSFYAWHLVSSNNSEYMVPSPVALSKVSSSTVVIGVAFSPHHDKHLLYWGHSMVKVGLINETWNSFKKVVQLQGVGVNLDNLVGCCWVHDERHVLVWTQADIFLFEVQAETGSASLCTKRGFPVPAQDVIVVSTSSPIRNTLFAVQENGMVLKLALAEDAHGVLQLSEISPEALQPSCRLLAYIREDSKLLCEASDGGVFITNVGDNHTLSTCVTLLPPKLDVLGKEKRLGAPYRRVRYLGKTKADDGASYHTICCTATMLSKKERREQLIVIRFNHAKILVEDYDVQSSDIVGLAACSFPDMKLCSESIVIAVATSSGEIQFSVGKTGNYIFNNLQPTVVVQRMQKRRVFGNFNNGLLSFEDMRNATAFPSIHYQTNDSALESNALKSLLSADSSCSLAGKRAEGFSIFVFKLPYEDDPTINSNAIVALRILFGSSPDTTPKEARVFDRKIVVGNEKQRWYSIILRPEEIATVARTGFISLEIGPTAGKSLPPTVDGLEIYVDDRGASESALPFCLNRIDHATKHRPFRDSLLFLLQSLRDLKMKTLNLKASKAEKSFLRRAVEATALSSDLELGGTVDSMIASIEGDQRSRLAFQDKATLKACFLFLSRCKTRLNQLHGEQLFNEWISLNPLLRSCLQAASGIARTRPYNFLQIGDETSGEIRSIASDASALMVQFLTKFPSNESLVSDLVDMILLELAVVSGSPRGRFGSFDGLQQLLSSSNDKLATLTCASISKFCQKNDIFSAQKMAVEYVCDSCLRVIANTRFSVQSTDAVFDLCSDCFLKGQEYAAKQEDKEVDVLVGGRTIGTSPKLSCASLRKMRKVDKNQSRSEGTVEDSSHRQQLRAAFMDGLCSGLGGFLRQKLLSPGYLSRQTIQLCVDLIRHGLGTKKGSSNATSLLSSLTNNLSLKLVDVADMSASCLHTVGLILEGLASMIVKDKSAREFFVGTTSDVASCDAITNSPGLACPFHLTRCKSYMFSGGTAKGRRFYCCSETCLYFKWKDDRTSQDMPIPSINLRRLIWEALELVNVSDKSALMQMRDLVSHFVFSPVEEEAGSCLASRHHDNPKNYVLTSGVLCHLDQFNDGSAISSLPSLGVDAIPDSQYRSQRELREAIVQNTIEIIALSASSEAKLDDPWLHVLSRIALNTKAKASSAATTAIRNMVGKSRCRSVLEHFAHVVEVEKLVDSGRPFLQYAITLTKKAAICAGKAHREGPDHVETNDLLGMNHLVSDDVSASNGQELYKAVNEILVGVSKTHQKSWATFCSLKQVSYDVKSSWLEIAPVRIVFSLVCTCPSQLQGKLLRLLNAAVGKDNGRKIVDMLKVSCSSLVLFTKRFVLMGTSGDARSTAAQFVSKLLPSLSQNDRFEFFRLLCSVVLKDVGRVGRRSSEFFSLLQGFLRNFGDIPKEDVKSVSSHSFTSFISQLVSSIAGRANGDYIYLETRTSSSYQKRRFELSECASCRLQIKSKSKTSDHVKQDRAGVSLLNTRQATDSSRQKCAPEQMTPCLRGRLAVNRESTVSDEFSTYIALKHRIAISAVHLEVENTRREVKQINVYYSPRPVEDADKLKSPEYSEKWQLCTTLKLNKALSRVNVTLSTPVVASNLRIEYAEFSDRSGTSADGKVLLSCPRCSGNVTNAHGLCTTCGEVAFQCRKCRHINYDRLDAFLCVECGYCASGNFRFDLTAGYATNAIAITNDEEYDRAKEMLRVARSCHENLRTALRQKFSLLIGTKRKDPNTFDKSSFQLKRAFGGDLPLQFREAESDDDYSRLTLGDLGKPGTVLQRVASHESSQDRWPPTCPRRQARSTGANDETAAGILTRGGNDDGEEESTSDIISNLLESGGLGGRYASGLDSSDPLSRLLASVQGRHQRTGRAESKSGNCRGFRVSVAEESKLPPAPGVVRAESRIDRGRHDGQDGGEGHDEESSPARDRNSKGHPNAKASIEVCDRLYLLMQEAEREAFELEQRCLAWQRLNRGDLSSPSEPKSGFEPSHCSACQPPVALHLLTWWHALFKKYPDVVPVTKEMIRTMLGEQLSGNSSGAKTLQVRLREAMGDIALLSPEGRDVVLDLLRDRIRVLGDTQSAEVLGGILERMGGQTEISAPFIALAKEALGSIHN